MVDATIVKVHVTDRGKGDAKSSDGKSKGGVTTKILALVDALGIGSLRPVPGQRFDTVGVEPLIEGIILVH